ncbi:MAG: hypothetical protein IJW82_05730 [Clostridia bacterium]|nr:hypothetical protein [Clostridia bacterium]
MNFTESRVKNDLKNIKYFNSSVKIYENATKYFKRQYEQSKKQELLSSDEMESLENCIKIIDSNNYIERSVKLKERYLSQILKLDSLTQAIIIDAFINDCTYIEISQKVYCSIETVKRRVKSGIEKLTQLMNEEEG